jgi:hypothetical protein
MKLRMTVVSVVAAVLCLGFFTSEASAGYSSVSFRTTATLLQYARVYVNGQSCYIESDGECNFEIVLYNGNPGDHVQYRVRYSWFPNNGGFAPQEIAHQDFWITIPFMGGNLTTPTPDTVELPVSLVAFTTDVNPGNGYRVYVVSSDKVGEYLDATLPKKNDSALGNSVGNSAGNLVANVKMLAGCYSVSFAAPWNNTGTGGATPITKWWRLPDPVCVDGDGAPYAIAVTVP